MRSCAPSLHALSSKDRNGGFLYGYHYTLAQLLAPFETTLRYYCRADYQPFFAFYGAELVPGEDYHSTAEEIERSAENYAHFVTALS